MGGKQKEEKTMIPDKIYIRHYWMPEELDDDWQLKPVEDEQCEEYIRKDALIELIKEESKFWDDGEMIFRGLIDKLNSM